MAQQPPPLHLPHPGKGNQNGQNTGDGQVLQASLLGRVVVAVLWPRNAIPVRGTPPLREEDD